MPYYAKHWQEYILCVLFKLALPLLPLILEAWITGTLSVKSLMISAAIYAISIGNSSRNKLLFGISVMVSIVFSVCFGLVVGGGDNKLPPYGEQLAMVTIIVVFFTAAIEMYTTYITKKYVCWDFN